MVLVMVMVIKFELRFYILIKTNWRCLQYSDKIVNNVEILAQSSADFALTYNFQGTHIIGRIGVARSSLR